MTRLSIKQYGVSLIELMLGVTLSTILAIILTTTFIRSTNALRSIDMEQQLQRTALYAAHYLSHHIKHSAYFGNAARKARIVGTALPPGAFKSNISCENSEWTMQIWQPLAGTNQNQTQYPCLSNGTSLNRLIGDTITSRYSSHRISRNYSRNTLYARSSLTTIALFQGKDRRVAKNNITPPYTDRKFNSFTFYISRSRQKWCNQTQVPALTTMSRSRSGKLRRSTTIAGIEQMQIQYSSDYNIFVNADKVTNWDNIKSCKIWLLVRSLCHYYNRPRRYQLRFADIEFQSNDRFRRKLSSFIIALRNNAKD